MPESSDFVHVAELALDPGVDRRAPGGEVTRALCGHWQHEPPCRWPHLSEIEGPSSSARLRTEFTSAPHEAGEVHARIEHALRSDDRWRVVASAPADLDEGDAPRS